MTNNEIGVFMDPEFLYSMKPKMTADLAEMAAQMNNKLPTDVEASISWKRRLVARQLKRFFNK